MVNCPEDDPQYCYDPDYVDTKTWLPFNPSSNRSYESFG